MWTRVLALILSATPLFAQTGEEADALYRAEKWSESAAAYQQLAEKETGNGQAWYRLGVSRHHLGKYEEAIAAYRRAESLGFAPAYTSYNLAAAYARSGAADRALLMLKNALAAGFVDSKSLGSDSDFESLRADSRFVALMAEMEKKAHPCRSPEFRALDFWVGEWRVRDTASGREVGSSSIQRILDDCVILENWTGARGHTGKSFNTIDPATKKWRQTWTDSSAQIYDFTGEPGEARMVFSRIAKGPDGAPMLVRMTLSRLTTGEVRQLSEQSSDGGKSWRVGYDFTYAAAGRS